MEIPEHPAPIPPLFPTTARCEQDRLAQYADLRARALPQHRDLRRKLVQQHHVPGPAGPELSSVLTPSVKQGEERGEQLCDAYEEVHCVRLTQLYTIYARRQRAAGKPIKKLGGSKFWIAVHTLDRPVFTATEGRILAADADGAPLLIKAEEFKLGSRPLSPQMEIFSYDMIVAPGRVLILRGFKFEVDPSLGMLVLHAQGNGPKARKSLSVSTEPRPIAAKQAMAWAAELTDAYHMYDATQDLTIGHFRDSALLGMAALGAEVDDLHVLLLQNIAQGCLKLQQNVCALFYALAAMRVRDRHGHVPPKAAYRAALACWRLGLIFCIPYLLSQVDRGRCPAGIEGSIAALLRKGYRAVAQLHGDTGALPVIVPTMPMSGGQMLCGFLALHLDTLREHSAAHARAATRRILRYAHTSGSPYPAPDAVEKLQFHMGAEDVKHQGTAAFQRGDTAEALMLWRMALDAAQMPVDDGSGCILGVRQREVMSSCKARLFRLLKGLAHASTSGNPAWQAQQKVPAFMDLTAATLLTPHAYIVNVNVDVDSDVKIDFGSVMDEAVSAAEKQAVKQKLQALCDWFDKEDVQAPGAEAASYHGWAVDFSRMKQGPKGVEAAMERAAAAAPAKLPGAEGLPPDMQAKLRASQAAVRGYEQSRRAQDARERAYDEAQGVAVPDGRGAAQMAAEEAAVRAGDAAMRADGGDADARAFLKVQQDISSRMRGMSFEDQQSVVDAMGADGSAIARMQEQLAFDRARAAATAAGVDAGPGARAPDAEAGQAANGAPARAHTHAGEQGAAAAAAPGEGSAEPGGRAVSGAFGEEWTVANAAAHAQEAPRPGAWMYDL